MSPQRWRIIGATGRLPVEQFRISLVTAHVVLPGLVGRLRPVQVATTGGRIVLFVSDPGD